MIFFFFFFGLFVCFTLCSTARVILQGSLREEESVHTSWSRFCTVNHRAWPSNYQFSNMKCPGRGSNRRPQRLKNNFRFNVWDKHRSSQMYELQLSSIVILTNTFVDFSGIII